MVVGKNARNNAITGWLPEFFLIGWIGQGRNYWVAWFRWLPVALLLLFYPVRAQDPVFSHGLISAPLENPALLPDRFCANVVAVNRFQWYLFPDVYRANTMAYLTSLVYGSVPLRYWNSAVVLALLYDRAGAGLLKTYRVQGNYLYAITVARKWQLHLGAEFWVWQQYADREKLVFGDQLDPIMGLYRSTSQDHLRVLRSPLVFSTGAGAALMTDRLLIGFALHHLNKPNLGFSRINPAGVWEFRYSIQLVGSFTLDPGAVRPVFVMPYLFADYQNGFMQAQIGVHLLRDWLEGLVSVRRTINQTDAVILGVGVKKNSFGLYYSFDVTVSRLGLPRTAGVHEFALVWKICPNERLLRMQCPFDVWAERALGRSKTPRKW